jgi:hypothetical protein
VLAVALAQPGQEVGNVLRADVLDLGPAVRRERGGVALQVAPVCLERVRGKAPLDRKVVEIAAGRLRQ